MTVPSSEAAATEAPPEPSDLAVAIRVGQKMLAAFGDSSGFDTGAYTVAHGALTEALRLVLRAAGVEPEPRRHLTPDVLRLRTQMRAAGYNPDHPNEVEALACVVTIDTDRFRAVLTGRAPLDWRIPRQRLTRTLSVAATGPDPRTTPTAVTQ